MATVRISARTVKDQVKSEKAFIVYDTDLKGFGLRVLPSGMKSYVVEYRPGAGGRGVAKKRVTIGSAKTLTADEARAAARDMLAQVRLGDDPAARRQSSRDMPTLAAFSERFIDEACVSPNIKPRTKKLYADNLRRLAVPQFGAMKLDAITGPDIARLHRKIGKTAPTQANNMLVTLSSLWKFAGECGVVLKGTNPVRGATQRFKTKARERYLTAEEITRLADVLIEAEARGLPWILKEDVEPSKAKHRAKPDKQMVPVSPFVIGAIRLLLFSGCRRSEILNLQWSEVDFERSELNFANSKTGKKTVQINAPALAILAELPRVGQFVIAGREVEKARVNIMKAWYRIRATAGLDGADGKQPFRLHDFRHSYASIAVSVPILGKLLGHTQPSTTQRYAHLAADPMRRAAETIGATIQAAMNGDKAPPVISMVARKK